MGKLRLRLPRPGDIIRLMLPDYGHTPRTPTAPGGLLDVAEELPTQRNPNAAMAAAYEDHVAALDVDAHVNARKCLPVQVGVSKLAGNIATLNWEVRGGNAARREWLHKRFEGFYAWASLVENYVWSKLEGARYHQMKPAPARGDMFIGFDFEHGAAFKEKAGGTIHNDGVNLYEILRPSIEGLREPRLLPRRDWIELRPGLTRNPEGDSTLGMSLVPLVQAWHDGIFRAKQSAKAAGFPVTLIEHSLSNRRPGSLAGKMANDANRMRNAQATPGSVLSMSDDAKARILEPTPGMMRDVWEHLINISGMVYQALLHNSLTTQTTDSGPTGSSYVHLNEEQIAVLVAAIRFIEMFNRQAVPRLFEWNIGFDVPPLNEGEEECYFWPAPVEVSSPGDAGEQGTGDIEKRGASDVDAGTEEDGPPNGNGNGRNRIKEFVQQSVRSRILALADDDGVWRTINGAKVFIKDGVVTKGPQALVGRPPESSGSGNGASGELKPADIRDMAEESSLDAAGRGVEEHIREDYENSRAEPDDDDIQDAADSLDRDDYESDQEYAQAVMDDARHQARERAAYAAHEASQRAQDDAELAAAQADQAERARDPDRLSKDERAWVERIRSGESAKDYDDLIAEGPRTEAGSAGVNRARRDAIVRAELASGSRVTHISGGEGRGSIYMTRPDGTRIRVSDHELPNTEERAWSRAQGNRKAWDIDLSEIV